MGWNAIKIVRKNATATLQLARPEVFNALNTTMINELGSALQVLTAMGNVRALAFTGAGERAFCTGADIHELAEMSPEEFDGWMQLNQAFFDRIAGLAMPTVAAINGYCLGGGLELALACDIRIAREGSKLGFPEAKLGLIPGTGGTQRLTRLLGPGVAKDLILTGRRIAAEEALSMGLVSAVVPADEWETYLDEYLVSFRALGPIALRNAKRAIDGAGELSLEEGLDLERQVNLECFSSADFREGVAAFDEKRAPRFRGK